MGSSNWPARLASFLIHPPSCLLLTSSLQCRTWSGVRGLGSETRHTRVGIHQLHGLRRWNLRNAESALHGHAHAPSCSTRCPPHSVQSNRSPCSASHCPPDSPGNRNIWDPTGWIAGWLEWNVSRNRKKSAGGPGLPGCRCLCRRCCRALCFRRHCRCVCHGSQAGYLAAASAHLT